MIRRVCTTAINFPCIKTLQITMSFLLEDCLILLISPLKQNSAQVTIVEKPQIQKLKLEIAPL